MMPPTSQKLVQQLIGLVNYYLNMWARCSHTLETLNKINSSKVKFKWNKVEQEKPKEINPIVARNILSSYPDFNTEFRIHINASDF